MMIPSEVRNIAANLKSGGDVDRRQLAALGHFFSQVRQEHLPDLYWQDAVQRAFEATRRQSANDLKWLKRWTGKLFDFLEKA